MYTGSRSKRLTAGSTFSFNYFECRNGRIHVQVVGHRSQFRIMEMVVEVVMVLILIKINWCSHWI